MRRPRRPVLLDRRLPISLPAVRAARVRQDQARGLPQRTKWVDLRQPRRQDRPRHPRLRRKRRKRHPKPVRKRRQRQPPLRHHHRPRRVRPPVPVRQKPCWRTSPPANRPPVAWKPCRQWRRDSLPPRNRQAGRQRWIRWASRPRRRTRKPRNSQCPSRNQHHRRCNRRPPPRRRPKNHNRSNGRPRRLAIGCQTGAVSSPARG